jgi:hypothetical protein
LPDNPTAPWQMPWDEVMKPLGQSPLWPYIRQAASIVLEHRMHAMGDFDSGISSSDINHTIFGVAASYADVDREADDYPGKVLTWLVHEGGEY